MWKSQIWCYIYAQISLIQKIYSLKSPPKIGQPKKLYNHKDSLRTNCWKLRSSKENSKALNIKHLCWKDKWAFIVFYFILEYFDCRNFRRNMKKENVQFSWWLKFDWNFQSPWKFQANLNSIIESLTKKINEIIKYY